MERNHSSEELRKAMEVENNISSCRHCLFYEAEGRRGGQCQQLGVPVRGSWKTCSLASPPFTAKWQALERLVTLPQAKQLPYNSEEIFAVSVELGSAETVCELRPIRQVG
ncbi:MAG: hypothetical protein Kow00121_64310 [Elainellaceae cyanobacterium]